MVSKSDSAEMLLRLFFTHFKPKLKSKFHLLYISPVGRLFAHLPGMLNFDL